MLWPSDKNASDSCLIAPFSAAPARAQLRSHVVVGRLKAQAFRKRARPGVHERREDDAGKRLISCLGVP